jgi:pimeloyl-ACP methyl ester carboxylesterase
LINAYSYQKHACKFAGHDHDKQHYPERNVVDLTVQQFGKPIKLASFRFSPINPENKRGVIFFLHGFGSFVWAHKRFLMALADGDWETFAIDYRGFGESEGKRGVIESPE